MSIREKNMGKIYEKLFLIFIIFLLILCLIFLLAGRALILVRVSGNSMYPTFKNGDILFLNKDINNIHKNDIVVFNLSKHFHSEDRANAEKKKFFVKRVVGVPGDYLCSVDGYLYVNGFKENEYYNIKLNYEGLLSENISLKNKEYFVLGDNRNDSFDSRYYGYITKDDIVGIYKCKIICNLFK